MIADVTNGHVFFYKTLRCKSLWREGGQALAGVFFLTEGAIPLVSSIMENRE